MSTIVVCPECKRKLKLPEKVAGKSIRCPACETVFSAPKEDTRQEPVGPEKATADPPTAMPARPSSALESEAGDRTVEEMRPRRKPIRKRSSTGLIVGLVVGGVFFVLILGGSCIGLVVYLVTLNQTIPDSQWQAFTPPGGGFSVLMPGTPADISEMINELLLHKYEVRRNRRNVAFSVAFFNLDVPTVEPNLLETMYNAERDNLIRVMKGRVIAETPLTLRGLPGHEAQIVASDSSLLISRIYLAKVGGGHRVFVLTVGGGSIKPGEGDTARFFNSFQPDASVVPPIIRKDPAVKGPRK